MGGSSSDYRKSRVSTAFLTAVLAAVLVGSVLVGLAVPAGAGGASVAGRVNSPLTSGPIVQVQGSSSGLSTTGPTQLGTVTVVPDASAYSGSAPVRVTVTLKPTGDLQGYLNAINNPSSSEYRHFLTASAVGLRFGVPSGTYASAVAYFQSFGLSVQPSATLLTLSVSGTVAQVSAAFHTNLAAFQEQYRSNGMWRPAFGNQSGVAGTTETGPTFYANTAPASLPSGLAGIVSGIVGLDGMAATPEVMAPMGIHPGMSLSEAASFAAQNTSVLMSTLTCNFGVFGSCPESLDVHQNINQGNFLWTDFSPYGFTCGFYGICGQTQFLFPSTMPALSGAHNLWSGASTISSEPDTGQGITIAVIEVGCAMPSDLSQWSMQAFGDANQLPSRVTQIAFDSGNGFIPNNNLEMCILNGEFAGWTIETELDVEYAAAMAPGAHIDVFGVPYPGYFSDFDTAYADIAQYLSLGSTGGVCPTTSTLNAAGLFVVQGTTTGACSIAITSNSYGSGEGYTYFFGSPMYITAENQELALLNAVGVTNFFASGDSGGVFATVEDFIPASSLGATSVGGAQVTAVGEGSEFPVTSDSFNYCDGFGFFGFCYGAFGTAYWAPASGIGGAQYWSYGFGIGGTEQGAVGGGFGQSITQAQPWWQNGLDTYSTGSAIDPVVSGSAAFNMTIFAFGQWFLLYGGTSFATPVTAGEFALIEEQANVAFGRPTMGDVNPILYAAHNGYQAGAEAANPYVAMQIERPGFDASPINSFTWYYYNLSIQVPSAPVEPVWFPTLFNPAGSGWNYLQGVGIPMVDVMTADLIGQTGAAGHALANPAFAVLEVTPSGLMPFTTLTAGTTYTLAVVNAGGQGGTFNVQAYSMDANAGTFGGGMITTLQTGSNGEFTYTPMTGSPPGGAAATTYGYFLVTSLVGGSNAQWSFAPYAVGQAAPQGATLMLCVVDPYGNCDQGEAENTMFTTTNVGFYNLYGQSEVYLNGAPVAGAMVSQVAVQSAYGLLDPTLPPADYAPGVTIGQTISDSRGEAVYWTDAFLAEVSGTLDTEIFQLTATYDGLTSNTVTVFVEPQSGSFLPSLSLNSDGSAVVGSVSFAGMKYVDFVNVSIGPASNPSQVGLLAGQSELLVAPEFPSYAPYYDPVGHITVSGVQAGDVSVDLPTANIQGAALVTVTAVGSNDVSFSFCFFGFCFTFGGVENQIIWRDPIVFLPTTLTASATGTVTGDVTFTFSGSAYPGATGTLSLVTGGVATVLKQGLSGTFTLDTTKLADGPYTVVYSEQALGASGTTKTVQFYVGNSAAGFTAQVAQLNQQLAADAATISSLQAQIASIKSADQATISNLQSQLASLQSDLTNAQNQVVSLQSQLSNLNSADQKTIADLKQQLQTANGNVASLQTQVSDLQNKIADLQGQLTAKNSPAPFWVTFPGGPGGVLLVILGVAVVVGSLSFVMGRRRRSRRPSVDPFDAWDEARILALRKEIEAIRRQGTTGLAAQERVERLRAELAAMRRARATQQTVRA